MWVAYIVLLLLIWALSSRLARAMIDHLPPPAAPTSGIVISLTTLPSRVQKILPTLYSLLDQTVPARIEIYIPEKARPEPDKVYEFPAEIRNHPQIKIIPSGVDLGPSMKFIPAVKAHQAESILVIDDDIIYSNDLVEKMLQAQQQNDSVIWCARGNIFQGKVNYKDMQTRYSYRISSPERVSIVTGCGGYLIPPKVSAKLRDTIDNYAGAPGEVTVMDDVWISGLASRLGIEKYLTPGISRYYTNLGAMLFTPAHLNEQRARKNEVAIAYFENDWLPEETEGPKGTERN